MANLLAHFEPTELNDFMNFIGLSIHKLQEDMLDVLDQLIGPLSTHVNGVLAQPVTGTDDQIVHADMKRAYLGLLISIISSKLHTVFISDRKRAFIRHRHFSLSTLMNRQQRSAGRLVGEYATPSRRSSRSSQRKGGVLFPRPLR